MGKADSAAKECLSDNVRFADLCNAVLFGGEQVVKADQLTEKDSTEVLSVLGADPKQIYLQKWRDLLKNAVVKTDNNVCFVLFGVDAHVFVPSEFDDFGKFQTELKQIFEVLSAAGEKQKMKQVLSGDERFQKMDNDMVRIINDIAGTRISLNKKGEVVNMCKAWEEQYEDGVENGKRELLFSLVNDGCLEIDEAVKRSGMSEAAFLDAMEAAGYKVTVEA